ncbi:MAG: DNA replication/repair protein RecF [Balneolaceae bacterium]
MRIHRLKLQNFRNHQRTEVSFAPRINLITGQNGAGKTNVIDAVHYLCMSRSFVASSDRYVVHQEESFFMIEGDFSGKVRSSFTVGCSYSRGEGKKVFVNGSALERMSDLVGMVPVVVLSPEDVQLTAEGPAERRSFLDSLICQISPAYLRDLITYQKVRRHRNRLLQEYRGPLATLQSYLEPWNQQLADTGSRIIHKRAEVLAAFSHYLELQYRAISGMELRPSLQYQTITDRHDSPEQIRAVYLDLLEQQFEKEAEREQTLIGPHRDEVVFYLDEMEVRNFGSQGQHRIFSVSLKMAQLFYYSDQLDDLPILLLDDLFGNLDDEKTRIITETLLKHSGQTLITSATRLPLLQELVHNNNENKLFSVTDGRVSEL